MQSLDFMIPMLNTLGGAVRDYRGSPARAHGVGAKHSGGDPEPIDNTHCAGVQYGVQYGVNDSWYISHG